MNFKKNWKRFWTLSSAREGFTLVELIVVIAILAILAGVAVPAYSGYVTKANQQADITLAGEIKQALVLAHYSGKLTPGATVVVRYGGGSSFDVECSDESAEAAMIAVFGENYAESLRLKYDSWELGTVANSEMIRYVNNSSAFNPESGNLSALLDNVQYLTDQLAGVTASGGITIDANSDLGKYLTTNGIDLTDSVAASNATVLFVADNITNTLSDEEDLTYFAELWGMAIPEGYSYFGNDFTSYATSYANALALATYIDNKTGTTNYVDQLNGNSGVEGTAIKSNIGAVLEKMQNEQVDFYNSYMGSEEAEADAMAFLTYMNGITSSSDSLFANTDLGGDKYYNDGSLLNYVTDYMTAGITLANIGAENGAFVFVYNPNTEDIVSCIPLDY